MRCAKLCQRVDLHESGLSEPAFEISHRAPTPYTNQRHLFAQTFASLTASLCLEDRSDGRLSVDITEIHTYSCPARVVSCLAASRATQRRSSSVLVQWTSDVPLGLALTGRVRVPGLVELQVLDLLVSGVEGGQRVRRHATIAECDSLQGFHVGRSRNGIAGDHITCNARRSEDGRCDRRGTDHRGQVFRHRVSPRTQRPLLCLRWSTIQTAMTRGWGGCADPFTSRTGSGGDIPTTLRRQGQTHAATWETPSGERQPFLSVGRHCAQR